MGTDWVFRTEALDNSSSLDERDLIFSANDGPDKITLWGPMSEGGQHSLALNLKLHGAAIVVNASQIVIFATSVVMEKRKALLLKWRPLLEKELARAQESKAK